MLFRKFLIASIAVGTGGSLAAQNLTFLEKSPISYLTASDEELVRAAWAEALNDRADGETVEWQNDETGHFGSIRVLDTHEDFGTTCRTVRSRTRAGGLDGGGRWRACKADDGSWRFAPLRQTTGSDE